VGSLSSAASLLSSASGLSSSFPEVSDLGLASAFPRVSSSSGSLPSLGYGSIEEGTFLIENIRNWGEGDLILNYIN